MIRVDTFTGLAPKEGERTHSATRNELFNNVTARKGDLRPLKAPVPWQGGFTPKSRRVLEDTTTGTLYGGRTTDGLITDQFSAGDLVYAVIQNLPLLMQGGSVVGAFNPVYPTVAPTVDVTENPLGGQTGIGDSLDAVSAAPSPVRSPSVAVPSMITYQTPGTGTVQYEFPRVTIMQAMAYVLDNYSLALPDAGFAPTTFRAAITELVNIQDTQPMLTRIFNASGSTQMRSEIPWDNYSSQVEPALQSLIGGLALATHRELTGSWGGSFLTLPIVKHIPVNLESPENPSLGWVLNVAQIYDINPAASGVTYTQAPGVIIDYTDAQAWGLTFVAQYVAGSWRTNRSATAAAAGAVDSVTEVFSLSLDECASARANPSYQWYGLYSGQLTGATEFMPFTIGSSDLNPNTEVYAAPVPRAYCYTLIDEFGRESLPSEPTVVTDQGLAGSAANHTVTCPDASGHVGMVAIYRQVVPHGATEAAALEPVWSMVSLVTPSQATAGVGIQFGIAGYTAMTTEFEALHPDVPRYLRRTESGHAVCTDAAGKTVYISKRHRLWAFPYNRRLTIPSGLTVLGIETVGNDIYVVTDAYPIVYTLGEDKGDEGLQVEEFILYHANYGYYDNTLVNTGWGVMYWSRVGVLAMTGAKVTVVTTLLIDDDQVSDWAGDAAVYYDGMYFTFTGDRCVILDVPDLVFGETIKAPMGTASVVASAACATQGGDLVLLDNTGQASKWDWKSGAPMMIQVKTAYTRLTQDAVFTAAKIQGRNVEGVLYCYDANGLRWSRTVKGDRPLRTPPNRCRGAVSMAFSGTCDYISAFELSTSMGELAST